MYTRCICRLCVYCCCKLVGQRSGHTPDAVITSYHKYDVVECRGCFGLGYTFYRIDLCQHFVIGLTRKHE